MKKQFNILSLFVAIVLVSMFTLTSCGDEENEPQPKPEEKTAIEKVKEAVSGSTWTLISAEVVANDQTFNYTGGSCDFSAFAVLGSDANITATNVNDFKYTFDATTLSYAGQGECANQSASNVSYTIKEESGVFTLTYKHGQSTVAFELVTAVDDLDGNEVVIKSKSLRGVATSATLKFKRS